MSKSLRAMLMINKEGGRLDIPDTGVSLEIPSGALEGEQIIQMMIIPHHLESESLTFASNSSLVVELLPSNLNLLKPAILTLPHCLVLKKGCEWKAKIYRSHHKKGSEPQWEEQSNTHYKLGEHNCVIEIQRFSWEKIEILDKIVEAKNIVVYAAGRRGLTDSMLLDIGYYWDLATCKEVTKRNNASLLHEQPTVFIKDAKPLTILLDKFEPMTWTCSKGNNPQVISFEKVAISKGTFCTFVLGKTEPQETDTCMCHFKAGQAPNLEDYTFLLKAPDPSSGNVPSTSKRHEDERVGTSTAGIEAPDLVVTTDTIEDLYDKFCREWKTVGRKLNIGEPKLQAIDKDNQDEKEKVYQMLLTWQQSKGNKASYRLLGEAFEAAGLQDLQQFLYKQAGDHHYEQRYGDNSQEGRRLNEEPINQDERPSEVERTPRELHVGSDGLSTSSDLGDQQIKIKNRNEDRERSSSKYDLKHEHLEDSKRKSVSQKRKGVKHKHLYARERERASVGIGQSKIMLATETERASVSQRGGQSTSIMESRESASAGRGREQSKFSLTTGRKSISLKRVKHTHFEDTESKSVSPKRAKHIRFSDGEPPEEHQIEDSHPSSSASDVENTHNRE
ncbi:netrin receptor unc5-like protein [Apostichopus japonicus]|uniref:Netrin receptor UNC5 n=1 Tax=Stichopus japonicus TaxID=307972 RepID=A0A2G8JU82_STIJA|nr:netrin receptor unc5-like protein [Apostichopus japonicus]